MMYVLTVAANPMVKKLRVPFVEGTVRRTRSLSQKRNWALSPNFAKGLVRYHSTGTESKRGQGPRARRSQ